MATTPYASIATADSYFLERLETDAWDNASEANQLKALQMATRWIDMLPLIDAKADSTQEREFPRTGETEVATAVQEATCELALALLNGKTMESYEDAGGLASESVGSASRSYRAGGKAAVLAENFGLPSPMAARLLAPWIKDSTEIDLQRVN